MTNRQTQRRRLHAELLESRYCLTGLGFATHDIAVVELLSPFSQFADIDGDGHLDVVSAGGLSPNRTISWHRNTDGKGTFENLQPMVSNISSFSSPFLTVDLDGDFDPDLLTVVPQSPGVLAHELVAFENVDGKGTFRKSHVLDSDTAPAVFTAIESADLDGDGDADVIASVLTFGTGSGRMIWYENIDGKGGFGEARVITNNFAVASRDIFAAGAPKAEDLDGDGDLDIVADSKHIDYDLDVIIWFENTNGRGDFSNGSTIAEASNFIGTEVVDLDGDDDLDILTVLNVENFLSADEQAIVWYENENGNFGDPELITTDVQNVTSVIARDIDGDGFRDVLALSNGATAIRNDSVDSSVTWYRNEDRLGRFVEQSTFDVLTARLVTGDADGDGDLDLLASTSRENTVSWYANSDGLGLFAEPHIIVQATSSAASVLMGDLDGDDDLDLVSASQADIVWFENRDGAGAYVASQNIYDDQLSSIPEFEPRPAILADVDGDDDLDVVSMVNSDPFDGSTFAVWFENTNGLGDFGEKQVIGKIDTHPEQMLAADLDSDGDLDVAFASPPGALPHSRVGWFENGDGKGDFGNGVSNRIISNMATAGFVAAVDMDQDGDLDVLSNDQRANPGVIWSENNGPESPGDFSDTHAIYPGRDATRVVVADFDGDGDDDVITADYQQIAFVENLDDVDEFDEPRVIEASHSRVYEIIATDLDSDGDLDLIASLLDDASFPIVWYENQNGVGDFGERQLIRTLDGFTSSVAAHDINGDGNLDLIAASKTGLRWFEQRLPGDSNGDGIFNSSDLITAFAANEYEDQFNLNSTFQEGDWNGDGDFDSSDLIFVFQAGTYSANARMAGTPTAVALNWIFIDRSEKDKQRLKKLKATTHEQSLDEQLV